MEGGASAPTKASAACSCDAANRLWGSRQGNGPSEACCTFLFGEVYHVNKVIEQWNGAARAYMEDQEQSAFVEINKRIVAERFPDLTGKTALDLGCGYGVYAGYFASVGAETVGCDGSAEMLRLAREQHPHIRFDQADILQPLPYADDSFDVILCNQVLMDVDPIAPLLGEVHRILKPGGTFLLSIVHPAFFDAHWGRDETGFRYQKIVERYLSEYWLDNPFWGETRHYHRPMSTYVNAAIGAGLNLIRMDEPVTYDGVRKSQEFPLFLFLEFAKA